MSEFDRKFTPAELRRLMGFSLDEMAKELGISHMTLQRREKGESEWRATEIKILSELSQIPVDRIDFLMHCPVRQTNIPQG